MEKKLVVAYLVRPAEGGIKSHLLALLSGLDTVRFEPAVISPPGYSVYEEAEQGGWKVIPLDIVGDLSFWKDFKAVLRLRRILRRLKPDVLHIHSAKAGLIGRLAAATLPRRPKVVLTVHSFIFDERTGPKKRTLVAGAGRILSRFTDRVIAVSHALKDELTSVERIDPAKITVIHNGIQFTDAPKVPKTGLQIGTVSRLAPQKGVEYFIKAAPLILDKFPEAEFTVIGDGPHRGSLEFMAEALGVKHNVKFLGFREDATSIATTFDVFVLASTREAFGLTLVEALGQGVAVVASRVGGIPEIVDGSTTGLLAEPADPEDIAAKVCKLLEDKELAHRLARQGSEFVRSNFNSSRMVAETQDLYLDLLEGGANA